jgi:hypothetical protein
MEFFNPDDTLVAVLGLQIGMLAEKVCNSASTARAKRATRFIAQDLLDGFPAESAW